MTNMSHVDSDGIISYYFSSYPDVLNKPLRQICSNIQVWPLLSKINDQLGMISIQTVNNLEGEAVWSWKDKTIKLNLSLNNDSLENQILCIVFELCNASKTRDLAEVKTKVTGVEEFVSKFERIEHWSALKTKEIATQILGTTDHRFKYVIEDFSLHYALQQISGHSEDIAKKFFPHQIYRGTLYYPLNELTDVKIRKHLYAFLYYYCRKNERLNNDKFLSLYDYFMKHSETDLACKKALDCINKLMAHPVNGPPKQNSNADDGLKKILDLV